MYLKSLSITNYRKFRDKENTIEIAHSIGEGAKPNVANNTTLMVGRNNTGKTTVIDLLRKLSDTKIGNSKFTINDFNLNYLQELYEGYFFGNHSEEDDIILPTMEFSLTIGIDDFKENTLANFQDVLILKNIFDPTLKSSPQKKEDKDLEITIDIKYKSHNESELKRKLKELRAEVSGKKIEVDKKGLKTLKEHLEIKDTYKDINRSYSHLEFLESRLFKRYLSVLDESSYIYSFYPEGSDEEAERFSLSQLLEVKMIKANTVTGDNVLSDAYNKIIRAFITNMDEEGDKGELLNLLETANFNIKELVDNNYTMGLNEVIQQIDHEEKLQMNLLPGITLDYILRNVISYEYKENGNFVPENQFGLGYTNLMIIIAELIDYIESYNSENYSDKINIICIEEPETFMHPHMQEQFISNIEKAIDKLYNKKNGPQKSLEKINYQLIISTHSPHILNSKIHEGNSFNNINYLSETKKENSDSRMVKVVRLSDTKIIEGLDKISDFNPKDSLTFIKKHMRLETSNVLFADAVIFVEGPTEELYLKYLLSKNNDLNKCYISVISINGAHGKVYFNLIKQMGIPAILYTDLDFKRIDRRGEFKQLNLITEVTVEKEFTTNATLLDLIGIEKSNRNFSSLKMEFMNRSLNEKDESECFLLKNDTLTVLSQWKINGYYATSLEEAIILTNHSSEKLKKILKDQIPNLYRKKKMEFKDSLLKRASYYFQCKLDTNNKKTAFINQIIFEELMDENGNSIKTPRYLERGLEILIEQLKMGGV